MVSCHAEAVQRYMKGAAEESLSREQELQDRVSRYTCMQAFIRGMALTVELMTKLHTLRSQTLIIVYNSFVTPSRIIYVTLQQCCTAQ